MASIDLPLEHGYTRGEELANAWSAGVGLLTFLGLSPQHRRFPRLNAGIVPELDDLPCAGTLPDEAHRPDP